MTTTIMGPFFKVSINVASHPVHHPMALLDLHRALLLADARHLT
jgi:hypothetical protein